MVASAGLDGQKEISKTHARDHPKNHSVTPRGPVGPEANREKEDGHQVSRTCRFNALVTGKHYSNTEVEFGF